MHPKNINTQKRYINVVRKYSRSICPLLAYLAAGSFLQAAPSAALTVPVQPSAPVGTPVNWTATATDTDPGDIRYRWEISGNGTDLVFRDYNVSSSISWIPIQEGPYTVIVTARNLTTGLTSAAQVSYSATSLLNGGQTPVVTATGNPLVAIYSSVCPNGSNIRVIFAPVGTPLQNGMSTPYKPCAGPLSVNVVIAGMKASTTYQMYQQVSTGFTLTAGAVVNFTTSQIPPAVAAVLPTMTVSGSTSAVEKILLESFVGPKIFPAAYDTSGNVIWYNYPAALGGINQLMRPLSGGTLILAQGDLIQEIDLLGNIVHETNITRVSEQLSSAPFNILHAGVSRIADFNHEAIRLPNGDLATLAVQEKIADQGDGAGNVDVLGDMILVLDRNWQVTFAWDPFTHLDLTRKATLNDKCATYEVGCPLLTLFPPGNEANDWTHANSLNYTGDGNFLLSMRNQDWVIKIDYKSGTGNVLWRFGAGEISR
jgi:arylsulfate sulfotransferase